MTFDILVMRDRVALLSSMERHSDYNLPGGHVPSQGQRVTLFNGGNGAEETFRVIDVEWRMSTTNRNQVGCLITVVPEKVGGATKEKPVQEWKPARITNIKGERIL